jgi:hypothetical protein
MAALFTRSTPNPCPVCGHHLRKPPWDGQEPSGERCPCCGILFGVDDQASGNLTAREALYDARYKEWIKVGMPWTSRTHRMPPGWSPEEQIRAHQETLPLECRRGGYNPDPRSYPWCPSGCSRLAPPEHGACIHLDHEEGHTTYEMVRCPQCGKEFTYTHESGVLEPYNALAFANMTFTVGTTGEPADTDEAAIAELTKTLVTSEWSKVKASGYRCGQCGQPGTDFQALVNVKQQQVTFSCKKCAAAQKARTDNLSRRNLPGER